MSRVAILGAGSWGTTLATILARDARRDVILWARDADQARALAAERENKRYLPGIRIPDAVAAGAAAAAAGLLATNSADVKKTPAA